jgi:nucleoside-diphosphate-sugar epimerase
MTECVLVAGCGDVGMRVAGQLDNRGCNVFGLRRSAGSVNGDVPVVAADLTNPTSLCCLPSGITHIAYLPSPDARTEPAYRAVYIIGLRNLLDTVDTKHLQRVIFVSSSAVYGDHGGGWADENTPPQPPGFNGAILLKAERWLAAQNLPAIILRLTGLYGPARGHLYQRLLMGKVRVPRNRPFWANRIHVDDAAAAIIHLLFVPRPERLYLGVDDTPLPLDVLYDHLAGLLGAPPPAAGPSPGRVGNKRLSNTRLRQSGFVPRWPDAREGYTALLQQER